MVKWRGITDAELELLNVLFRLGPSKVSEICAALPGDKQKGHTTVQKLLQLMHGKGLVDREEEGKAHIYRPADSAEHMRQGIVDDVVSRVFDGSAKALVMQALGRKCTPDQLAEIEQLLADSEKDE